MMNQQLEKLKPSAETIAKAVKSLMIIAGTFIVAMIINTVRLEKIEQKYIEEMRAFKQQADSALLYADSLEMISGIHDAKSDSAVLRARQMERIASRSKAASDSMRRQLDSIRATITDSVEMARVIIPMQDSIIKEQDTANKFLGQENLFLKTALAQKDTALIISNIRGDSLENVIRNIPEPPPAPKVGKIKRTTVFIIGFVTGVVVDGLLFRH